MTSKKYIEEIDRVDALGILASINWEVSSEDEWEEIRNGFDLIPNKLRLRTLTEEEKSRLSRDFSSHAEPLEFPDQEVTILELKDSSYSKLIEPYYNYLQKALLAFRLLKFGYIYLDGIYLISHVPSIGKQNKLPIRHFDVTPIYKFCPSEIVKLLDILNKLESIDFENNNTFRIACKRLENSYYSYSIEDTLIDLMIGFEALFIRSRKGNKGHRIGKRCSELIENNKTKQKTIYNELKKAYGIRNDILHGSPFNRSEIFQLLLSIEDYLRKSILRLIP